MNTVAETPSSRAASATPCAWLPALAATTGDIVVFVDSDLIDPDPMFVPKLVGPLLKRVLAKAIGKLPEFVAGAFEFPADSLDSFERNCAYRLTADAQPRSRHTGLPVEHSLCRASHDRHRHHRSYISLNRVNDTQRLA